MDRCQFRNTIVHDLAEPGSFTPWRLIQVVVEALEDRGNIPVILLAGSLRHYEEIPEQWILLVHGLKIMPALGLVATSFLSPKNLRALPVFYESRRSYDMFLEISTCSGLERT